MSGKCVPGDPINEIKNGPIKASLAPARDAHVLLCRTVKRSTNFFQVTYSFNDAVLASKVTPCARFSMAYICWYGFFTAQ